MLTKTDFVRRYKNGEFGNASPTWNNPVEFRRGRYSGLVHLRNRIAGGPTWYNVKVNEVEAKWHELCSREGVNPANLYISGMAPHHKNLIQGEVIQSHNHLDLLYTTVPNLPMRDALATQQRSVSGIMALLLLQYYLCSNSYDWLQHLLTAYPEHVIEFSTFGINWGTLPNFNTVFWEVRRY